MRRNDHGGKESGGKSILTQSAGSWSVSERVGEVWFRRQRRWKLRDEQVMDGAPEGECCDGGGQVVQMVGFFLPLRTLSLRLVPPLSFYAPQLQLPFSCLKLPLFPSAFCHPTPVKLP